MHVTTPPEPGAHCGPVSELLDRIGERWTVRVVMALYDQPRRFNEIRRRVGGVSQQMLTRTLKGLERDGLVQRTVHATKPPQVEYALTALGRSLSEPVQQLGRWARTHIGAIHDNRVRYDGRHASIPAQER